MCRPWWGGYNSACVLLHIVLHFCSSCRPVYGYSGRNAILNHLGTNHLYVQFDVISEAEFLGVWFGSKLFDISSNKIYQKWQAFLPLKLRKYEVIIYLICMDIFTVWQETRIRDNALFHESLYTIFSANRNWEIMTFWVFLVWSKLTQSDLTQSDLGLVRFDPDSK